MECRGLIFDIKLFSVNDGPGIRTTVFFKGCPLNCWWCHNPESRSTDPEEIKVIRMLNNREFCHVEKVGKLVTIEEVMADINREVIFQESSGGGVTFSGGEPLMQPEFLKELAMVCRNKGIHTCLDTSGYCEPELFREMIPYFDLFLFDVKTIDAEKHKLHTGFSNEMIAENLSLLDRSGSDYILRIPLIPGVNDDEDFRKQFIPMTKSLKFASQEVHILPFHALGRQKLKRMGLPDNMPEDIHLNDEDLNKLVNDLKDAGYRVSIGG